MNKETYETLEHEYERYRKQFLSEQFNELVFEKKHIIIEKLVVLNKVLELFKDSKNIEY